MPQNVAITNVKNANNHFVLHTGVDAMITIFCDFRRFSAKKMAFFLKTNVMIETLQQLAVF
jgi:hypothetical protein